ncbi:hypothetical protein [Nocardia sp. IFM 10818]
MADGDNAFTSLKTDARNGGFNDSSKGVNFDPAVARTMAEQCAKLLSLVNDALQVVSPTTNLKPLNQRTSGQELADKLNAAAKKLAETVLKNHQTILTDMGETFVAAGKLYIGVDQAAAAAFESGNYSDQQLSGAFQDFRSGYGQPGLAASTVRVESMKMPGWGQSDYGFWDNGADKYGWSGTMKRDYGNKLSDTDQATAITSTLLSEAQAAGVALDKVSIEPDRAAQYEWDDFHNHWVYVKDSGVLGQLENFAQEWHKAQEYIKAGGSSLEAATKKYLQAYQGDTSGIDQIWASPAAQKAKTGITNYLTEVKKLTAALNLVSNNYAFAQGWLKKLQNFLPYQSVHKEYGETIDKYEQRDVDEAMRVMREAWANWYEVGVTDSSNAIPIMPDPNATLKVQAPVPDVPKVENPGTNNPGTNSPGTQAPNLTTDPTTPNPVTTNPVTNNPTNTEDKTQETLQTLITQGSTVLQKGIEAAQSAVETITSAVQQGLTSTTKTTEETQEELQNQLDQQLENLGLVTNTGSPTGLTTGGGSPTGLGTGSPTTTTNPQKTQLFPRAAVPVSSASGETTTTTTSRAGLATTSGTTGASSPMMGSPMSGASQGQQGKEHKRAQYLNAAEHLDEALGEVPIAVTPVAEK